jgi:hypothetical protein
VIAVRSRMECASVLPAAAPTVAQRRLLHTLHSALCRPSMHGPSLLLPELLPLIAHYAQRSQLLAWYRPEPSYDETLSTLPWPIPPPRLPAATTAAAASAGQAAQGASPYGPDLPWREVWRCAKASRAHPHSEPYRSFLCGGGTRLCVVFKSMLWTVPWPLEHDEQSEAQGKVEGSASVGIVHVPFTAPGAFYSTALSDTHLFVAGGTFDFKPQSAVRAYSLHHLHTLLTAATAATTTTNTAASKSLPLTAADWGDGQHLPPLPEPRIHHSSVYLDAAVPSLLVIGGNVKNKATAQCVRLPLHPPALPSSSAAAASTAAATAAAATTNPDQWRAMGSLCVARRRSSRSVTPPLLLEREVMDVVEDEDVSIDLLVLADLSCLIIVWNALCAVLWCRAV